MEETLKVSIGGVSFIINRDGFNRMDAYLRAIENHYAKNNGGREIVDDIESRIAELLLEKYTREEVVTLERVENVISIMGTPSQFDQDAEGGTQTEGTASFQSQAATDGGSKAPRRLFRDTSDRMLGGVCSGLAHYFRFDPSVLRVILAAVFFLNIVARGMFGWVFLHGVFLPSLSTLCFWGYIILWIVIPSAKTYTQRCQMVGADPGIRGAEQNFANQSRPFGWWLGRLLKVFLGVFLIFLGLCCLAIAVAAIFQPDYLFGSNPINALNLLELNPWVRILLKISFLVCIIIPCLGFLYEGAKLLFNLKGSKYHLGLIMFLVWVLSLVGFSFLAGGSTAIWPDDSVRMLTHTKTFPRHYDTLHVHYAALPQTVEGKSANWKKISSFNGFPIYVSRGKGAKTAYALYPKIEVERKSSTTIVDDTTNNGMVPVIVRDTSIRSDLSVYVGRVRFFDRWRTETINADPDVYELVDVQDSVINLNPAIITRKQKFNGAYLIAELCVPDSSKVIIHKME